MSCLRRLILAALLVILPGSAAFAGCGGGSIATSDMLGRIQQALSLERRLDGLEGQAALLAFTPGRAERGTGRSTHPALVWRDRKGGRWVVSRVHRSCHGDGVRLADRGLMDFLASAPRGSEITMRVPSPAVQQALVRIMRSGSGRHLLDPRAETAASDWLEAVVTLARGHGTTTGVERGMDAEPERVALRDDRRQVAAVR